MKHIYTITTMSDLKSLDYRCVGFFYDFEMAQEAVINNSCDIHEMTYDYAIIEEVAEGIYATTFNIHYYKYNHSTQKYELIEPPKELSHLCGFAIG